MGSVVADSRRHLFEGEKTNTCSEPVSQPLSGRCRYSSIFVLRQFFFSQIDVHFEQNACLLVIGNVGEPDACVLLIDAVESRRIFEPRTQNRPRGVSRSPVEIASYFSSPLPRNPYLAQNPYQMIFRNPSKTACPKVQSDRPTKN